MKIIDRDRKIRREGVYATRRGETWAGINVLGGGFHLYQRRSSARCAIVKLPASCAQAASSLSVSAYEAAAAHLSRLPVAVQKRQARAFRET